MKILTLVERRADYSRIKPILKELYKDSFFEVYLVVTGICLLDLHGSDIDYIKEDGFKINSTFSGILAILCLPSLNSPLG